MKHGWVIGLLAAVAGVIALGVLLIVLVTGGDDTLVLDLEAGQCFDIPGDLSDAALSTVTPRDCDASHEAEVFATGELDPDRDQPRPEDTQLFARVDRKCAAALAGEADAVERFGILPVVADETSWEAFRGRFVCVAIPYGGGATTGSMSPTS